MEWGTTWPWWRVSHVTLIDWVSWSSPPCLVPSWHQTWVQSWPSSSPSPPANTSPPSWTHSRVSTVLLCLVLSPFSLSLVSLLDFFKSMLSVCGPLPICSLFPYVPPRNPREMSSSFSTSSFPFSPSSPLFLLSCVFVTPFLHFVPTKHNSRFIPRFYIQHKEAVWVSPVLACLSRQWRRSLWRLALAPPNSLAACKLLWI